MLLRDLLCVFDTPDLGVAIVSVSGPVDRPVTGVHHDSREVGEDGLFVALSGANFDGHRFVPALPHAACVVVERPIDAPDGVTVVEVQGARVAMAHLAAAFHGNPGTELPIIGVTGTNGKTTTCALLEAALSSCGDSVGVVGTTGHRLNGASFPFVTAGGAGHTTPESPHLQGLLAQMRDAGATAITMEASSIGLAAHRVDAVPFKVAVFTNLSRDHLDFHGDMASYLSAKARLFHDLLAEDGVAILPLGIDESTSLIPIGCRVLTTGFEGADISVTHFESTASGTTADVRTPVGSGTLRLPLAGRHNLWNALGAIGAGVALGRSLDALFEGLEKLSGVDGRLEAVPNTRGITVLVDYAHTPDALEQVLIIWSA